VVWKGSDRVGQNPCLRFETWGTRIFCLGIFTVMLQGCRSQPELTPEQATGQRLYAGRCAHCHEENDLALKPPPPNIHGAMAKTKLPSGAPATDAEVRRLVLTGKGNMPSFQGRFTEQQMAALLAYLHTEMPFPK